MSYQPYSTEVVLMQQRHQCSTMHIVIAWVFAVMTLGYLLPWAVAATRGKRNVLPIALINIFLGWSLVGWVVALVLACVSDPAPQPIAYFHPAALPPYGPGTPEQYGHPQYGEPQLGQGQPPTSWYGSPPPGWLPAAAC